MNDLESLVSQYQSAPDDATFAKIAAAFRSYMGSCCQRFYLPGGDDDDIKQIALLALLQAVQRYDRSAGWFRPWAKFVIRRRIITVIIRNRQAKFETGMPSYNALDIRESADDMTRVDDSYLADRKSSTGLDASIRREILAATMKTLRSALTPLEKRVLKHYLKGLSYNEIRNNTGIDNKSIDNALSRIKAKAAALALAGHIPLYEGFSGNGQNK